MDMKQWRKWKSLTWWKEHDEWETINFELRHHKDARDVALLRVECWARFQREFSELMNGGILKQTNDRLQRAIRDYLDADDALEEEAARLKGRK